MIQVSVLYPNDQGCEFDISYYCDKQIPMVKELLGSALKGLAVEEGLSGMAPGSKAAYVAAGHLRFDSVEAFRASFGPHAKQIFDDVPNYTNTQPVVMISEVKI